MSYGGDQDGFSTAAARHYRSLHTQMLRGVLALARRGALRPDWRDRLQPPQRSTTTHHIYTDGDVLAVAELRQREYAAWEPGQASNWRDALTSWYLASRVALHDDRALPAEIQIETVKTRDQTPAHALEMRVKGVNAVDALDRLEVALDSSDVSTDSTTRTTHELYIAARDELGASYRAGLRAGGDDVDWVGWYRDHINRWPAGTMREVAAARLEAADYQQQMETLPGNWR